MPNFDYVVIGAGIVGLATALKLQNQYPGASVCVIEKESTVAAHQSGHSSGVVHAGVYYEPGSIKAQMCFRGSRETIDFCQRHQLPILKCGKLIVATNELERTRLFDLHQRAQKNGVSCELLDRSQLLAAESAIVGVAALRVAATAVVDYRKICEKLAELFTKAGGILRLQTEVLSIREAATSVDIGTDASDIRAAFLIVCGGLQADRLVDMAGLPRDFSIIPFRGDFYTLKPDHCPPIKHLIYPVPDPALPFLGVHLTHKIDGGLTVGPSAMLALHRERYRKVAFSPRDTVELARSVAFWRLLSRYPGAGARECLHAISRRAYLKAVQTYCPWLSQESIDAHQCGIRAQAVARDGSLIHDFKWVESPRSLHLCNAPSPAATAAIPIAAHIVARLVSNNP